MESTVNTTLESAPVESPAAKLLKQFVKARAVSTPLIIITTPDPAATVHGIRERLLGDGEGAAMLHWDIVRGVRPVDMEDSTSETAAAMFGDECGVGNPAEALTQAEDNLPEDGLLFMANIHRFLDSPMVVQAVSNLRDTFKENGRTLVGLCPSVTLPLELANDVLVLDEPRPTREQLEAIVLQQYTGAREGCPEMPELDEELLNRAVDASLGLAAFTAEQSVAMSIVKRGMDTGALWERKRQAIEQTKGLTVYRGVETFADVEGCANAKKFIGRLISKTPPQVVLWFDEIEKSFAGLGKDGGPSDNTGTTQDQLQQVLTWTEERKARAILLVGFPGTGKSLIAKATGGQAGAPTAQVDLGAMKSSGLGDSEATIREVFKTVDAMAPESVLVIATCNDVSVLPPELLSRFRRGQFFFDLPTETERAAMWRLHMERRGVQEDPKSLGFDHTGWTGREVEACCDIAHELELPLREAAKYVVPVSRTMRGKTERLRQMAADSGFLSASYEGPFELKGSPGPAPEKGARKLKVMD